VLIEQSLAESIARQALSEPYRQIKPISTRKLERFLKDRDIGLRWETLHHLWAVGVVHPVAVLDTAIALTPNLEASSRFAPIELGDDRNWFVDLGMGVDEMSIIPLRDDLPTSLRDSVYWHPFQIWQFDHLSRLLEVPISRDTVLQGHDTYVGLTECLLAAIPSQLVRFSGDETHSSFLKLLALLLSIEPLVHATVFRRNTYNPSAGESVEGYFRWVSGQDGVTLLTGSGIDIDAARKWHERLAISGHIRDPFGPFRSLVRRSRREGRKNLKGSALLAQDLYDTAEVLRRYLGRYYALELEEELKVGRMFRGDHEEVLRLRLRRFDLDPQECVVWFVEGTTEEAYVRAWADRIGVDLRDAGIEVRNVEGTGYFNSSQFRTLLEYYRRERIFAFVSVDEDADENDRPATGNLRLPIPEHVRQLRWYDENGLFAVEPMVWQSNFVMANFGTDEIAAVATKMLIDAGKKGTITADEITQSMQYCPDRTRRDTPQNVEDAVKSLLWQKATLPFAKGKVWGEALAAWAIEQPRLSEGQDEWLTINDDQRPITQTIVMLLGAKRSDYDLSLEIRVSRKKVVVSDQQMD